MKASDVKRKVDAEIAAMRNRSVADEISSLLVEPRLEQRDWEYGAEHQKLPCWIVLESSSSDVCIAFSEKGFGPERPWGLVFASSKKGLGMDSAWHRTLEEAFADMGEEDE